MTTNRTTLGARVKAIRYQQSFPVPLTLVGQNLAEIAKQRPVQTFRSNVTHLHLLDRQVLNHDLIVIADQLGRELLHQVVLDVGHPSVIMLQLGSRFSVMLALGGLLTIDLALAG